MDRLAAISLVWDLANENALPDNCDKELQEESEQQAEALQIVYEMVEELRATGCTTTIPQNPQS